MCIGAACRSEQIVVLPRNPRRRLTAFVLLIVCAGSGLLVVGTSVLLGRAAKTRSLSIRPGSIDFGVLAVLETVQKDLLLRNEGSVRIVISDVHVSCGCMEVGLATPLVLAPGEQASVPVRFRFRERMPLNGRVEDGALSVQQQVIFHVDAPKEEFVVVPVMAVVESQQRVVIIPPVIDFGTFGCWESKERTLVVQGPDEERVNVHSIKLSVDGVSVSPKSFVTVQRDSAQGYRLILDSSLRAGSFEGTGTVSSSKGAGSFRFVGRRMEKIYGESDTIVFSCANGRCARKTLVLHHRPDMSLAHCRVASKDADFHIEGISEVAPGVTGVIIALNSKDATPAPRGILRIFQEGKGCAIFQQKYLIGSCHSKRCSHRSGSLTGSRKAPLSK